MGTRAFITVEGLKAGLYRHHDGYPDSEHGVLVSLVPFATMFLNNRGNDPEYFLARLVESQIKATEQQDKLTGFGIIDTADPKRVDHQHHYHVDLEAGTISVDGRAIQLDKGA